MSPCLFNLYTEHIRELLGWMSYKLESNRWEKYHNLRYVDDIILKAESKEELKNLLMRVKEESENADLKLNIIKTKIMASGSILSWQIEGESV